MSVSGPVVFAIALLLGAALGAALVADRAPAGSPVDTASVDGGADAGSSAVADAHPSKASATSAVKASNGRSTIVRKDDAVGPATGFCLNASCTTITGSNTRHVSLGLSGASWGAYDLNLSWSAPSPLTTRLLATLRACPSAKDPCTSSKTILASVEGTSPLRFRDESAALPRSMLLYLDVSLTGGAQPGAGATASPQSQPFHVEGLVKAPPRIATT